MRLLLNDSSPEFQRLSQEIYNRQMISDAKTEKGKSPAEKKKVRQSIEYNLDVLYVALELEDGKIFESHARWFFQLLCPRKPSDTREAVRDCLLEHYSLMKSCIDQFAATEKRFRMKEYIDRAMEGTIGECKEKSGAGGGGMGRYEREVLKYLECLMRTDTKGAVFLITEYAKSGIPLPDIFVDIIGRAMIEVGEMWQSHLVSVDKEHYCTSTTQLVLSQLYPIIFRQKQNGKKLLVSCVGGGLHEMGARMVADLFEYDGWDSTYLGSTAACQDILNAIAAHCPDLLVLSASMPQHLASCKVAVEQVRGTFPEIKIAVGGRAFASTDEIWKKWRVDVYTQDARDLVAWADEKIH